tara:strand:+ start:221 stop:559 length:339 start_codon:yes stop_codon:yes gene_type:complete
MTKEITYAPDYRSPPSGCGTVEMPDGKLVLITSTGGEDYFYDYPRNESYDVTIDIPLEQGGRHYKLFYKVLKAVLENLGVTHVYDPENAYISGRKSETYTLDEWCAELDRLP